MSKIHEHWTSRLGFIMATAGSAIGLGSLWRFPYVAGENGGGAFVLLYLFFTFIIGLPVFIGELVLGRYSQKSALLTYYELSNNSPNWKGLGWLNVFSCLLILSYYSVVAGWCLSYVVMSLNKFYVGLDAEAIKQVFNTLYTSPGINLFWFGLFLLINMGIVFSGVRKGIEHWSKILMPALFVSLMALFCYALTLPGFSKAVAFTFVPDFTKLNASSVLNALGMAFFSLSVGLGIIVTYGSYMNKKDNIPYNGTLIAFMTVLVSLISALTIFPIVFSFGFPPEAGPGLVFQTLPVLFAKLPASILLSTLFFSLLFFAALTSTISLLETIVANMLDLFEMKRETATIIATILTFVVGIPSALSGSDILFPTWKAIYGKNFFDTVNYLTASWFMPFGGLLVTLFLGWRLNKEIPLQEFGLGTKTQYLAKPWFFMLRWVVPVAVGIIIIQETGLFNFAHLFKK
ncbi:MAG: sodium-dependent transporter [Verrucomicrobia bacterium]|nr:sodium-dependent transporter [Verrucomicrobiota bacterium]